MARMETHAGQHLREALSAALEMAQETGDDVTFDFNGIEHDAHPWESYENAKARVESRTGHPLLTAEEEAEHSRKWMEETATKEAAAIAEAAVPTEVEMRDATVPRIRSEEELLAYVRSLVKRPHDYGTCVYAMSMAAVAAFNYAASELGVTGFQASCADLDILRRIRGLKHGFRVLDYGNLLYPQYWDEEHFPDAPAILRGDPDLHRKLAEEARANLARGGAHANVQEHWRRLIATAPGKH